MQNTSRDDIPLSLCTLLLLLKLEDGASYPEELVRHNVNKKSYRSLGRSRYMEIVRLPL